MYSRFINWLSATRFGSFLVRNLASRLDPVIYRASKGRFTMTGRPTLPMLTMTVIGRKSGQPRTVQLAYHQDGDDLLVVASAMGADKHPAWRYNLEANPDVELQLPGQRVTAHATILSDEDKNRLMPAIATTIPQMHTYFRRTDRNIRVFRLAITGDAASD